MSLGLVQWGPACASFALPLVAFPCPHFSFLRPGAQSFAALVFSGFFSLHGPHIGAGSHTFPPTYDKRRRVVGRACVRSQLLTLTAIFVWASAFAASCRSRAPGVETPCGSGGGFGSRNALSQLNGDQSRVRRGTAPVWRHDVHGGVRDPKPSCREGNAFCLPAACPSAATAAAQRPV